MAKGKTPTDLNKLKKKVLGLIDRDEVVGIACDLVNIPSPTGFEKPCADYIIGRYNKAGIKHIHQEFEEQRANAIGVIKGDGTGPTLMLNGHMDTSYVGDERYLPDKPGYKPKAVLDGGWIYGLGIYNMKGGLAAFIHAAECVKRAGVFLKGDLVIACVAGEIEKSQVDHYQGPLFRGGACGTWYAITHGAIADFAVVGEPSGMTLMRAHGGYVWTKITLIGDPKHTVFGEVRNNTIHNMLKVAREVEKWGADYEKRSSYLGMGAKVTLSAIEGGWPYRCSRVPVYCTLYVDTRLMPDQGPLQVQREIEALVAKIRKEDPDVGELHLDMNVFMNQWGSECSPDEFIFKAVARAHEDVVGKPAQVTAIPFASDACELVRHGITALNYGPSGRTRDLAKGTHYGKAQSDWNPTQGEHLAIEDLYQCTKVYASLILDVCNRTRKELRIKP
jgi:acetylornithine deacetylase/succinyl-diaminopimelate desuccinylase-like protein